MAMKVTASSPAMVKVASKPGVEVVVDVDLVVLVGSELGVVVVVVDLVASEPGVVVVVVDSVTSGAGVVVVLVVDLVTSSAALRARNAVSIIVAISMSNNIFFISNLFSDLFKSI
jgi:hypothetical protein